MPQAWKRQMEGLEVSLPCKAPFPFSSASPPPPLKVLERPLGRGVGGCDLHFCRYESGKLREEEEEDEEAAADGDWKKEGRRTVKGGTLMEEGASPAPRKAAYREGDRGPDPAKPLILGLDRKLPHSHKSQPPWEWI